MPGSATFFDDHLPAYLASNGFEGHFVDISMYGGTGPTTMLVLKTTGRQTGQSRMVPLIYDNVGSEYVIIASKGGAPNHPAWFLNLTSRPEVEFQVADKCFRGRWRIAEGEERARAWDQMAAYYPPYLEYQASTSRTIPVVMLAAVERIASLT